MFCAVAKVVAAAQVLVKVLQKVYSCLDHGENLFPYHVAAISSFRAHIVSSADAAHFIYAECAVWICAHCLVQMFFAEFAAGADI